MQVCAFATSEDAAAVAVTHTARDVAVVMHAVAQARVATSVVVRILETRPLLGPRLSSVIKENNEACNNEKPLRNTASPPT